MSDPLKGINVDAAGGAGKVLKMLAQKTRSENPSPSPAPEKMDGEGKEGVVAKAKVEQLACMSAHNHCTGS